ncbi:MAG: flagellar hook assembly protein FlgD [Candidatus Thiodiazotropha sp.]|jgi:flagellar basal-body rod modification protein FlgD
MTTSINANNYYEEIGLSPVATEDVTNHGELGLEDFMNLMITELSNQDPTKPMENTEMATQISQFATVSGIGDLNNSFNELSSSLTSNQALQAANLVGRDVLVESDRGILNASDPLRGSVYVPASASNIQLRITNSSGELVHEISLGTQSEGLTEYRWDGFNDAGDYAGDGIYEVSAVATVDGEEIAPAVLVSSEVESVSIGGSHGLWIDLGELGQVSMADVLKIQ